MNLVLHVKKKWWDQIYRGIKKNEFRLATPYWKKRLEGRTYDKIIVKLGYPKATNEELSLTFDWIGAHKETIKHEEWGYRKRRVYNIPLRGRK